MFFFFFSFCSSFVNPVWLVTGSADGDERILSGDGSEPAVGTGLRDGGALGVRAGRLRLKETPL